ncbi:MAG: hypothetical protein ACM339_05310, partial [Ignavibacteria bacterium]
SNPVTFTVLNPVPELAGINPDKVVAGSPELTMTLTGNNFVKTSEIIFNNEQVPMQFRDSNHIDAIIPTTAIAKPGIYPVKNVSPAPGGGETTPLNFTVIPPLEITITSPSDGATLSGAKTMTKGTFKSDTRDIGITVNGVTANIAGNEWIVNNVPLTPGTNIITATIKDSQDSAESASIIINTESVAQPVTLSANITSGISPLTTYFSVSTEISNPIVSYQMDFEGDGVIDYVSTVFNDINSTFSTEGIYYPTITITDDQGNINSDTIAIVVLSKEELDALLKGKWHGMKEALIDKNVEKAMNCFLSSSRERYRYIFNSLLDSLPDIVAGMQEIEMISGEDKVAEYRIKRVEDEGDITYYIYFMLDGDGLWKIRQF